jgi:hypothetical protein
VSLTGEDEGNEFAAARQGQRLGDWLRLAGVPAPPPTPRGDGTRPARNCQDFGQGRAHRRGWWAKAAGPRSPSVRQVDASRQDGWRPQGRPAEDFARFFTLRDSASAARSAGALQAQNSEDFGLWNERASQHGQSLRECRVRSLIRSYGDDCSCNTSNLRLLLSRISKLHTRGLYK